jgi:hypothetical protein
VSAGTKEIYFLSNAVAFTDSERLVGKPYLGITSGLPVTRPRSAAALQNCHFRNGAAASDASQNEGFATTRKQSGEVYTWGATVAGKVN